MQNAKIKRQIGFTLLFSILIITVVMGVSFAVFELIMGGFAIVSSSRDSQIAFYAADTGVECAFYWDIKQDAFSTTSPFVAGIFCNGNDVTLSPIWNIDNSGDPVKTNFRVIWAGSDVCADVTVLKYSTGITDVTSLGHNICLGTSDKSVERGINIAY